MAKPKQGVKAAPAVAPALARALAAVEAGRPEDALPPMIERWREASDPKLADAIDAVSRACRARQERLPGRPGKERAAAWEAALHSKAPEDLERLLEDLVTRDSTESAFRIQKVVEAYGRDPRLSRGFLDFTNDSPFRSDNTRAFWTAMADALVTIGDVRAKDHPTRWFGSTASKKLDKAKAAIAKLPLVTLDAEEAALAAEIASRCAAPKKKESSSGAELLAAIYDDPASDEKRLVYADWLSEQGDPRGEFILLQFARRDGTLAKGGATREKDLFTEGYEKWLGELRYLPRKGLVFERGFLDRGRPNSHPLHNAAIEWSTCRTVDFSDVRPFSGDLLSFANNPHLLKSIEAIVGLIATEGFTRAPTQASSIAASNAAKQLRAVGFRGFSGRDAAQTSEGVEAALQLLDVRFASLCEVRWFDRYYPLAALPAFAASEVAKRTEYVGEDEDGSEYRAKDGALTITLAKKSDWIATRSLTQLPAGIVTSLAIVPGKASTDALRAEAGRLGILVR